MFVVPLGLEPRTPWLWVRCSNQLSYGTVSLPRCHAPIETAANVDLKSKRTNPPFSLSDACRTFKTSSDGPSTRVYVPSFRFGGHRRPSESPKATRPTIDVCLCSVVSLVGPSTAVGVSKSRKASHQRAPKPHHVTLGGIDWCMDFISERNMT